ncbi:MAG: O-antigen ligase family protein [Acidobacteriota bacterium]
MKSQDGLIAQAAVWLAFASSALIVLGIAPSQILLGMALAAMLISRSELRLPPIKLPLALFLGGTLLALAFSASPTDGLPQVKKIYVFCQLLVAFSLLRTLEITRRLTMAWAALAASSATLGIFQFVHKVHQAHAAGNDFYQSYIGQRITGFMGHWYTFSVLGMLALLMTVSYLFFGAGMRRRTRAWLIACAAVIAVGIVLAETRAVWIATAAAGLYLVWSWRPRVLMLAPAVLLLGFFAAPSSLRTRVTSIVHPGAPDSNESRVITSRTGLRMIERHPLLGLGPELPRIKFNEYVPEDIPRPLPEASYMHLHNIYLQYAAERGIPTLLVFLWLIGKMLYDFRKGLLRLPPGPNDRRFLLHGAIAVIIALLIEGFADVNFGDSETLAMFLAIVACGYTALNAPPVRAR